MSSEALDKTVIMDNWQIFSRKLFQHFIHHKKYEKSQNFNLKLSGVQEFSTKIYPYGTLYPPPPLRIGLKQRRDIILVY